MEKYWARRGELKKNIWLPALIIAMVAVFSILPDHLFAAVRTWDGGGTDGTCGGGAGDGNKWSCAANWSADTIPTSSDSVVFDGTSTKDATIDASFQGTIIGMTISSGYTGIITQSRNLVINGTYSQADGTFTGGTSNIDINDGNFSLTGGTFIAPSSGTFTIERNFTKSGSATFTNNGGTVTFDDSNDFDDSTITCTTSVTFTKVIFTKDTDGDFTVGSGCTIPLGAAPTSILSTGTMTNAGTITVASGTWNLLGRDNSGVGPGGGSFTNNGTITHSGSDWFIGVNFTNGSSGVVTYAGSTVTSQMNFNVSSGTFPSGLTVTFTDYDENDDTTLTCGSVTFTLVVLTKDSAGNFIISSGCIIPLGASPTTRLSTGTMTNAGTITVASGIWNFLGQDGSGLGPGGGAFTNNGTITHSGDGWIVGVNFTNGSSGVVTYGGSTATFQGNLNISSGTFPSGLTATLTDFDENDDTTLTCGSVTFTLITITKDSNGSVTVSSGCTVPLGAAPTSAMSGGTLTNAGTITIDSGTWTITGSPVSHGTVTNNGTITHNGSGWINQGGFTNGSSGVVTYAGSTATVWGTFNVSSGTFPSGLTLTIGNNDDFDDTTLTCGSVTFAQLTVNKASNPDFSTFTLGSNCTITGNFVRTAGVVSNPSSAYTLLVGGDFSMSASSTFGGANLTIELNGGVNKTITQNAGTFSAKLKINKTVGISVTQTTNLVLGNTFDVTSGTFDQGATFNLITGGATTVGASGTWTNTGTGDVTLGGNVSNAGAVTLDGSGVGCGGLDAIVLSDAGVTQRTWSGAGTFTLQDLNVSDMTGSMTAYSSTNTANNSWTFAGCNSSPTDPSSLGSASYVDGSWGNDNTPTLTFTLSDPDGADTVQFRIQIDDTSDFSSLIVDYTSALAAQGGASFTVGQAAGSGSYATGSGGQTLSDSSSYYWRVKAIDNTAAESSYSTANSGAIAFRVDTVAPTAGTPSVSSLTSDSITIQVAGAGDALSGLAAAPYDFENTSEATNSGAQAGTTWLSDSLSVNNQYTFQVTVTDLGGNSSTSSTFDAYTGANPPTNLILTVDGPTQITADWEVNGNPAGTEFFAENSTEGTDSDWIADATSWISDNLDPDTSYTFSIKARNGDGVETSSITDNSGTDSNNPDAPSSLGPANYIDGSWGNDDTPDLTFELSDPDGGDTVKFQIQIDDTADFSSLLVDYTSALDAQGSFAFTVGQAEGGGSYDEGSESQTLPDSASYYWRVKAIDDSDTESAFTLANSGLVAFKIDTVAPTPGSLSVSTLTSTSITVQVAGASDDDSGLATDPYDFENTTEATSSGDQADTTWLSDSLSVNTEYVFQVTTSDLAGNSATSITFNAYSGANPPSALVLTVNSPTQITADWEVNGNPTGTEFFAENITASTNSGWIADAISWVSNSLDPDTSYSFSIKARNTDGVETSTVSGSETTPEDEDGGGGGSSGGSSGNRPPTLPPAPVVPPETPPEPEPTPIPQPEPTPTPTPTPNPAPIPSPAPIPDDNDDSDNDSDDSNDDNQVAITDDDNPTTPPNEGSDVATLPKVETGNGTNKVVNFAYNLPRVIIENEIVKAVGNIAIAIPVVLSSLLVTVPILAGVAINNYLLYLFASLAQFFGLRKKSKPWGTVYDSKTERPIPFARVEILNDQSRKLQSIIADADGRYGFLIADMEPETKIELRAYQNGYTFPSEVESSASKILYPHVYHGGFFNALQGLNNFDLPMDPISGTSAKNLYPNITSAKVNNIFTNAANVLFVVGACFGIVDVILNPTTTNFIVLGVIILTFALRKSGFKLKPFGTTKDISTKQPMPFSLIALHDKQGSRVNFTVSDDKGRYFLLTPEGKYLLKAYTPSHIIPMRQMELSINAKRGWVSREIGV